MHAASTDTTTVGHTSSVLTVIAAAAAAGTSAYAFSRFTGWISESITLPVGTVSLATAALLSSVIPYSVGMRWGRTGERWRLVAGALLGVVAVTAAFRLTGSGAPYDASIGEFVFVPLGEELLFRGVLLVALVEVFRRQLGTRAQGWAVAVSGLAFGAGHLGTLGYLETEFVVLQVFVATAFGLIAGWVRIQTDSLVGPVLVHATMNVIAVW